MNIHKIFKICFILMLISIFIIPNFVEANNFDMKGYDSKSKDDYGITGKVEKAFGGIINVVRIVGTGIALTIIAVISCKYMISSAGDRAEIKKHAVPYIIGAIVMMAASGIFEIITQFAGTI